MLVLPQKHFSLKISNEEANVISFLVMYKMVIELNFSYFYCAIFNFAQLHANWMNGRHVAVTVKYISSFVCNIGPSWDKEKF
jgi:hypothetical protein